MERQIITCIPIPGLNEWNKETICPNNKMETQL